MKPKTFFFISLILSFLIMLGGSESGLAETVAEKRRATNKKFRKSLIDKLNQEKQLIEKLLGVDIYKNFDGRLEKLLEQFDDGFYDNMDKIFKNENFNQFFQNADQFKFGFGALGVWSETGEQRIYTLMQNFPKNAPLDIKIEQNYIKIKGFIEKSFKRRGENGDIAQVKRMSVNQKIHIPHDVYVEKAQFDQLKGKTRILFPKKNPTIKAIKRPATPKNRLKPMKKRKGEQVI
jgi:hypothetical protein